MAAIDDAPDKLWISLGNPAQRKKGGLGIRVGKQLKNTVDVVFDPALAAIPFLTRDMGRKPTRK
jgi:hypothetical protein